MRIYRVFFAFCADFQQFLRMKLFLFTDASADIRTCPSDLSITARFLSDGFYAYGYANTDTQLWNRGSDILTCAIFVGYGYTYGYAYGYAIRIYGIDLLVEILYLSLIHI